MGAEIYNLQHFATPLLLKSVAELKEIK